MDGELLFWICVFVGGYYAVGADSSIDLVQTKLDTGRPIECPSEDAIARGDAPDPMGPGPFSNGDGAGASGGDISQCGGSDDGSSDGDGCESDVGTETDLATIAGLAGLAASDSINPCALAVLLILLTTISARAEGNARRVLAAGLAASIHSLTAAPGAADADHHTRLPGAGQLAVRSPGGAQIRLTP